MEILLAESLGFGMGVKRAVDLERLRQLASASATAEFDEAIHLSEI